MTIEHPEADRPSKPPKPGAPKGNQNARTHGFYSRYFPAVARRALAEGDFDGLKQEIELHRKYLLDFIKLDPGPQNIAEAAERMRTISIALDSLSRLIRTDKIHFGRGDPFQDMITQVLSTTIDEMEEERGITHNPSPNENSGQTKSD